MNILITGGAGYIGSVVTQTLLKAGHSVKAIDALWFDKNIPQVFCNNPNYTFIKGDICDKVVIDNIMKEGIDYIVHAAAVVGEPASQKFPELTYKVNYEASVNLISKASEHNIKGFIFFSTCSNYGISEGMATEETPVKPMSLYAETKVNVERCLTDKTKDLDWIICRLATVYGVSPRMRFDLTVNDFTAKAFLKRYIDIFMPLTNRPYIHVGDVAGVIRGMIKNFERLRANVFNVGFEGENYQKIQIAKFIQKNIPDVRIENVDKGTDRRDYRVDFSKLRRYLNIKNANTVESGVKEISDLLRGKKISDPWDRIYHNTSPDFGDALKPVIDDNTMIRTVGTVLNEKI